MTIEEIYRFFENPPPVYLNKELAVCYILSIFLRRDSYGTEIVELLADEYPLYRISDTVLYTALKLLQDQGIVTDYWKKVEGRGRPRRMYKIRPERLDEAQNLAELWVEYIAKHQKYLSISLT